MDYNLPTALYPCCNPLYYDIRLYRRVTGIATVTTTNQLFHVLLMDVLDPRLKIGDIFNGDPPREVYTHPHKGFL
jgi:hypothetical protein